MQLTDFDVINADDLKMFKDELGMKVEGLSEILVKTGWLELIPETGNRYRFSEWIRSLEMDQIQKLIVEFRLVIESRFGGQTINDLDGWEEIYGLLRKLMVEKYDQKLVKLPQIMKRRFEKLTLLKHKAFVFDVDGNLTQKRMVDLPNKQKRIEAVITDEILKKLVEILTSGRVVVLITGRMSRVDEVIKNLGESDVMAILEQIRAYLDKKLPADNQVGLLKNLYLISENGLGQITNGFREKESDYKRYDKEFFGKMVEKLGILNHPDLDKKLERLLDGVEFSGIKLKSERMYKFRGNPDELPVVRQRVLEIINQSGLNAESKIEVVLAGEVIDVLYYPVNKFSSLVFLAEELGIEDNHDGVIVKSGDNADPFSNDYPLVSQPWSMSSGKYDPFNPYMVALPLISGQDPGEKSTLWALNQLGV